MPRPILITLTVLILVPIAGTREASFGADGDWPGWRGPGRDGWVRGFQPPARWPQGDLVGWMGDFHPPDMHFTYLAGALFEPGVEAPEGFICRDMEAGEMAVSRIQGTDGPEGGDMHVDGSAINSRSMASHGYEYDGSRGLYEMEYHSYEDFYLPLERGEHPALEFYSPCKQQGK